MLIVYMMGIYLAAILALSVLTYLTSRRITGVKQSFKEVARANGFAVMAAVVVGAGLNIIEHWLPHSALIAVVKTLLTVALSIIVYGRFYSRHLVDAHGHDIPRSQGYLIAGANFSIILVVGLLLMFAASWL